MATLSHMPMHTYPLTSLSQGRHPRAISDFQLLLISYFCKFVHLILESTCLIVLSFPTEKIWEPEEEKVIPLTKPE
jgi:hypothetical protein